MSNHVYSNGLDGLLLAAGEVKTSLNQQESETPPAPRDRAPAEAPDLRATLQAMSETFATQLAAINRQMSALSERVDGVEQDPRPTDPPQHTPESSTPTPTQPSRLLCDRPLDEPLPDGPLIWPDDLEDEPLPVDNVDEGCQLHRISQSTECLLKEAFSKPVANATRRRWRRTHGIPASDHTKCPKLDNTLRAQVPKDCKDTDRTLS